MRVATALLFGAALGLAACSQGENPDGLFNRGGAIDPAAGGPGGTGAGGTGAGFGGVDVANLPPSSPQYFAQVIGDRVYFPVDQSTLTPDATAILDQQATWLLANAAGGIVIEGHADEQGTREYNIALSARRASAVRNYLVSRGIPDARLSTIPFGKERPVEVCSEERCWAQNRRAVTILAPQPGA